MGERDPGVALAAPPPPWLQRAVLAVALAALSIAALVVTPAAAAAGAGTPALVSRLLEAPLTAMAGSRGPAVLGALALALAAAAACRALERRVGAPAPLLVALLIFGSGSWALVWTAGAALVPLGLAVAAFALAYEGGGEHEEPGEIYRPLESSWRGAGRWLVVGLLLAELVPTSPLLAGLVGPAALAVPRERRGSWLPALLGGFILGLAVELLVQGPQLVSGPADLAAGSLSLDPELVGRNLLNLLVGRNVGLLVGFAPVLLLLVLGRGTFARPGLALVCLALPVLGALLLPFDFAAGWLNLSFLPVYGALWHLPFRPPRRWQWAAAVLLCGLATWPLWIGWLWSGSRAAAAEDGVRLASAWPRRYLPYESSLRSLPNRGEAQLERQGLRVRAVSGCSLLGDSNRFELDGAGPAVIWLAALSEVEMVALELGPGAPSSFAVSGANAGRTVFRPDGRVGFEVLLSQPRGTHRLWFDERPLTVHLINVRLSGWRGARPLRFRLLAGAQP